METKDLEFALKLAQPCLLSVDFIPILSHYCFDTGMVYAYDDVSAVVVDCNTDLKCGLRGDTLLGLVGLAGEKITLKQGKEKVEIISGNSHLELPFLQPKDFQFQFPQQDTLSEFSLSEDILQGLTLCAAGVGKDPRKPEFTGVTLQLGTKPAFYASDNTSIIKYVPANAVGKKALEVIVPKSICDQILATVTALSAELEKVMMTVTAEFLIIQFSATTPNVTIVGKHLTVKAAKFEKIIEGCETNKPKFAIPEDFHKAVAKVVLVTSKELQRGCELQTQREALWVRGQGALGKAETKFSTDHIVLPDVTVICSPEHLTSMLSNVTHMIVDEKVIQMRGEKLSYYVASRA